MLLSHVKMSPLYVPGMASDGLNEQLAAVVEVLTVEYNKQHC